MKTYVDQNGERFQIVDVEVDSDTWVHYRRLSDGSEFSSLLEAFNERFRELIQ